MGYHVSWDLDDEPPMPPIVRAEMGDTKKMLVKRKQKEVALYMATAVKVTPYFVVCIMSPGGYTECFLHSDWNSGAALG